ncbi:MAG: GNAT family N-acetyltransferase [Chryseobacterium sp.]|uniref:GNAT family N-acetyltransferase n=1 Tax=Chryseobacterium sp. TaxID=1871047 RepID=UPI001AFE2059|nr:GNAT family N-acetyltransferase [Chryseobacterium sp.]MBO6183169.1 GNAT family N-acetyltransferase [Chryseobacterium sp.]
MDFSLLTIRKATENDIDFLADLRVKTMNEHLTNSGLLIDKDSQIQRILYKFEVANILIYKETKIGLLKIQYGKTEIEIIQLQINPAFQGNGLGRYILNMIIEEASLTKTPITLSVLKINPALKLYLRTGFKIVEENEHSFIMKFWY